MTNKGKIKQKIPRKVSRAAATIEHHYKEIQQFIDLANLLPCEVRDGECWIDIYSAIANLQDSLEDWNRRLRSKRARSLRANLSSKSRWWTGTELARAIEHVQKMTEMGSDARPDVDQLLLLELISEVATRFRRWFPKGIKVGEDVWGRELKDENDSGRCLCPGDQTNVVRCYVVTRLTFAQIADEFADWKPGRFGLVAIHSGCTGCNFRSSRITWGEHGAILKTARDPILDGPYGWR